MNKLGSEVRWHVKKTARLACLAGTILMARAGVRVLTYHRFSACKHDPFAVDPVIFEQQMEWIAAHRMALTLDDLLGDAVNFGGKRKQGVLVTIDDGFASLHRQALPIFAKYKIPAVAFLPAGLMDDRTRGDASDPEPRLCWEQIRELAAGGVEIGSHGWSHRSFGRMDLEEMRAEASRSRATLSEQCGSPVRSFAYPFGRRPDYDTRSASALRSAGYVCAFTSQHGAVQTGMDPYELPRVKIEGGEPMWTFAGSCRGGLDAWRVVDRTLWRLQLDQA